MRQREEGLNMSLEVEDNYSIVSEDIDIWMGKLPYTQGDTFPPVEVRERAGRYKTYRKLYQQELHEIYGYIMMDTRTEGLIKNMSMYNSLISNPPDFKNLTDIKVGLSAARVPKIDGNVEIDKIHKAVGRVDFGVVHQDIRRDLIMYGNSVKRVDKVGEKIKVIDMPLRCWIPFVSADDGVTVEVNVFFNIYTKEKEEYCEFIVYHQDGEIEKVTHAYTNGLLGEQIGCVEQSRAYEDIEDVSSKGTYNVSPIVIFSSDAVDGQLMGESEYKYWDNSIAGRMRALKDLYDMLELSKDYTKIAPDNSITEESSGTLLDATKRGIMTYSDIKKVPEVKYVQPQVDIKKYLEVIEEAEKRICQDANIPYALLRPEVLGANTSAESLKTAVFLAELMATKENTRLEGKYKELISKIALMDNIVVDTTDIILRNDGGFVRDNKALVDTIQARNGGKVTLSVEDSIAILDDITTYEAKQRLEGIKGREDNKESTAGIIEDFKDDEGYNIEDFGGGEVDDKEEI